MPLLFEAFDDATRTRKLVPDPTGVGGALGATDNAVLRANGVGGKTAQGSALIVSDATAFSGQTYVQVAADDGSTTNMPLALSPKGTGAIILGRPPDGTATGGGNNRGAGAIDIQTSRTAATQVASGSNSVCIGRENTHSGQGGAVIGSANTAADQALIFGAQNNGSAGCFLTGLIGFQNAGSFSYGIAAGQGNYIAAQYSQAWGSNARPDRWGQTAWCAGSRNNGDACAVQLIARITTTNATPTELRLDGNTRRISVPSAIIATYLIQIHGVRSTGADVAVYVRQVTVKNISGTVSLVGSVQTIGTDVEDNAATDVAITADDTNDALAISVTGIASQTWRWTAVIRGVETVFGT